MRGLFRGATVRMGYLTLGGFAFFGVYEQSKRYILRRLGDRETAHVPAAADDDRSVKDDADNNIEYH